MAKISKKLTMGERFFLMSILPPADYVTFKILRKLKDTLAPSEEEIKWLYSFGKEVCGIVMVKENLWSLLGIEQERMIYNAEM